MTAVPLALTLALLVAALACEVGDTTEEQQNGTGQLSTTDALDPEQTLRCRGVDAIQEIRAEFAANHIRAKETYVGQQMCLSGTIRNFAERIAIYVDVGDEATFTLRPVNEDEWSRRAWRAWMLESSVGDIVEAECRLDAFTPTNRNSTRGIPLFTDCQRVVGGVCYGLRLQSPALWRNLATVLMNGMMNG